jgi:energy-coupling factor transport system ATP-binding protein
MEILSVKNLTFKYPLCESNTLSSVSFSLEKGDFAVLCGPTGSGKTTLLRLLKPALSPNGSRSGEVLFDSLDIYDNDGFCESKIGFVMQNPEQQIVTDKVWHELAFALENKNLSKSEINRRIAEAAQFFSLTDLFEADTDTLSGGQKQLLNLASVAVMQPELIILDEPTAQLDPVASSEFITVLKKLNDELGITVLISEHSLDELLPVSKKLIVLGDGEITSFGQTAETVGTLDKSTKATELMPSSVRLFSHLSAGGKCPLTVNESRAFLQSNYKNDIKALQEKQIDRSDNKAVEFKNVSFRFTKNGCDILCDLSFDVSENEIFCILGANGSGKTTALRCAAGFLKPYTGKISIFGKRVNEYRNNSLFDGCISVVPQDIGTVFLRNTVREELQDAYSDGESLPFDIDYLSDRHPYDISGGEQQLVALAKALAAKPRLLILDEPTKGLDNISKKTYADVISKLKQRGVTVIIVTHDVEFASGIADRCMFMFRGRNVSCESPREFFKKNEYYTSAANRISRGFYDGALTVEDILELIRLNGGEVL